MDSVPRGSDPGPTPNAAPIPAPASFSGLEPEAAGTSRWLKLAVVLLVALLCIAFAGLVWALVL